MVWTGEGTPVGGTYDLTTLAKAKRYLRITGTDDDTLLGELIDSATSLIESICDCKFASRSYSELYDGNGDCYLYLRNIPVASVSRLSIGIEQVLGIACNADGATWASIRNNGTSLILIYDTSSGLTTSTLSLGTYTTLTALAAAIDALAGWETTNTGDFGDYLTADILETPALYCLTGYAYLPMGYQAIDAWRWEEDSGRLYVASGFTLGVQNVYVEYTAGYTTIPADLELTAHDVIGYMYHSGRRDPALTGERLGDYSWSASVGGGDYLSALPSRLARYRRITI